MGAGLQAVVMMTGPFMQRQPVIAPLVMGIISSPFSALFIAALCAAYKLKGGTPSVPPAAA